MSVAYFIALNNEEVDFDYSVNGKNIAHALEELSEFSKSHKLKSIEDFYSQDLSEVFDDLDDLELPEQGEIWFGAEEGIEWVSNLVKTLKEENPGFLTDALLEDLSEYLEVFKNAKLAGARWHLELDF